MACACGGKVVPPPKKKMADMTEKSAVIMVRFNECVFQACNNALVKTLSITQNYDGDVVGLVHYADIKTVMGEWSRDKALAILRFGTLKDAKMWFQSCPEIRQNDWLGGADIILSPCMCPPKSCDQFIQLLVFEPDKSVPYIGHEIACELATLMRKHNAIPSIATDNTERLRGAWFTHFFIVNLFQSQEKFCEFGHLEQLKPIREKVHQNGDSNMIAFKLQALK